MQTLNVFVNVFIHWYGDKQKMKALAMCDALVKSLDQFNLILHTTVKQ